MNFRVDFKKDAEFKVEKQPMIVIPSNIYQKIFAYVRAVDYEISMLGLIKTEGNIISLEDVYLFRQECSGADTILEGDAIAEKAIELMKEGVLDSVDNSARLICWIHSHANMTCFWSSTDDNTCERTLKNSTFSVSIVVTRRKELLGRVDLYSPVRMTINQVQIVVSVPFEDSKDTKKYEQEVKDKVTEKFVRFKPFHTGLYLDKQPLQPDAQPQFDFDSENYADNFVKGYDLYRTPEFYRNQMNITPELEQYDREWKTEIMKMECEGIPYSTYGAC